MNLKKIQVLFHIRTFPFFYDPHYSRDDPDPDVFNTVLDPDKAFFEIQNI